MSKESILNNYRDINRAYNNSMAFDSLSMQLDEFEINIRVNERDKLIEDIIGELDILNYQGGGIDDIIIYLNKLKSTKQ